MTVAEGIRGVFKLKPTLVEKPRPLVVGGKKISTPCDSRPSVGYNDVLVGGSSAKR